MIVIDFYSLTENKETKNAIQYSQPSLELEKKIEKEDLDKQKNLYGLFFNYKQELFSLITNKSSSTFMMKFINYLIIVSVISVFIVGFQLIYEQFNDSLQLLEFIGTPLEIKKYFSFLIVLGNLILFYNFISNQRKSFFIEKNKFINLVQNRFHKINRIEFSVNTSVYLNLFLKIAMIIGSAFLINNSKFQNYFPVNENIKIFLYLFFAAILFNAIYLVYFSINRSNLLEKRNIYYSNLETSLEKLNYYNEAKENINIITNLDLQIFNFSMFFNISIFLCFTFMLNFEFTDTMKKMIKYFSFLPKFLKENTYYSQYIFFVIFLIISYLLILLLSWLDDLIFNNIYKDIFQTFEKNLNQNKKYEKFDVLVGINSI
jgi:hypothetical protein